MSYSYVGAVMMEVAYGHPVTSLDDEIVVLAEKAVGAATEAGSPAATLIDFLPFCECYALHGCSAAHDVKVQWIPAWMPGGGWKTRAAEVRKMVDKTSDVPYGRLKAAIVRDCIPVDIVVSDVADFDFRLLAPHDRVSFGRS